MSKEIGTAQGDRAERGDPPWKCSIASAGTYSIHEQSLSVEPSGGHVEQAMSRAENIPDMQGRASRRARHIGHTCYIGPYPAYFELGTPTGATNIPACSRTALLGSSQDRGKKMQISSQQQDLTILLRSEYVVK